MASEQQIAANRQNAQKSRGPRSTAGRKRASRNSYRHGLAATIPSTAERARRVERLAHKIAGKSANPVILQCAHTAVQAEFDLAQVRRVKVAMIEQISALGQLAAPNRIKSTAEVRRSLRALGKGKLNIPPSVEVAPPMPAAEPERTAEAVRRALPELLKLECYERRAAARRERAIRAIFDQNNLKL